jgi:ATP-dependent Clp protease ATP-binding subunit ClpC
VVLAEEEARALEHNYLGTEHLLLGLLREHEGLAARVLEELDVTVEGARAQVVRLVGSGEAPTSGQLPFTPRAAKVLELALREVLALGHDNIRTEHILLAIGREHEGVAARILRDFGADSDVIRDEVLRVLAGGDLVPLPRRSSKCEEAISVGPTARVRLLLRVAAAQALNDGRSEIDTEDVLLALTRAERSASLLAELGIGEADVRAAIERRRATEEPPETSTQG